MGKKFVLLAILCMLVVLAGCSGRKNTETTTPTPAVSGNQHNVTQPITTMNQTSTPIPATGQQPVNSMTDGPDNSLLYYESLVLPNGKVITSDLGQIAYDWKGMSIQLFTLWAYPAFENSSSALIESVLGNHVESYSQKPVTLNIGPAALVLVDRTPPAASGSHTITRECWLMVFHPDPEHADRQIAYTIQANLGSISSGDAASEILELSKRWKIPALQTKAP